MGTLKIALADDHHLFRSGIKNILESNPGFEAKIEAKNGKELLEKMTRQKVDIVITDISMPVMDGFEVAKLVSRDYKGVKLMGLSVYDHLHHVRKLVECGAHGYAMKSVEPADLLHCINKIMAGEMAFCQGTTDLLMKSALNKGLEKQALNDRDIQLLKLVFAEKTTEEISLALGISARREQTLMAELMEKLGVKTKIGLVKWMYEHGV